MRWTLEKIAALSQEERYELWKNAERLESRELLQLIEASGLPYTDPRGLKLDSLIGRLINKIINSAEGTAAALEATEKGEPALSRIDTLLKERLGHQYTDTYEAPIQAGYLVAKLMRKLGYQKSGRSGRILDGVAKSGEIYVRRQK